MLIAGGRLLWKSLDHGTSEASDSPETITILVADHYIAPFTPVALKHISMREFPRGYVPPGALRTAEELLDGKGNPGYVSAVPIPEGLPITQSILTEIAKSHELAALLSPGKVALSFGVDKEHGVGGLVQPGDTIALYETPGIEKISKGFEPTRMLLPAVPVLGVNKLRLGAPNKPLDDKDSLFAQPDEGTAVITVLLNLAQAPAVIQAREQGRLTVVLRAMGDDLEVKHDR
jgi:Flp pilus assembly protein CpaB